MWRSSDGLDQPQRPSPTDLALVRIEGAWWPGDTHNRHQRNWWRATRFQLPDGSGLGGPSMKSTGGSPAR
jgi:hypothetical protein